MSSLARFSNLLLGRGLSTCVRSVTPLLRSTTSGLSQQPLSQIRRASLLNCRQFSSRSDAVDKMRVAIIGQSLFGQEVCHVGGCVSRMWLYAHVKASGIYTKLIFCRLLVPLHCSQICVPDYLSLCVCTCTCQTVCVQAASISIIHVYSQCLLNHSTTKSMTLLIMITGVQAAANARPQCGCRVYGPRRSRSARPSRGGGRERWRQGLQVSAVEEQGSCHCIGEL